LGSIAQSNPRSVVWQGNKTQTLLKCCWVWQVRRVPGMRGCRPQVLGSVEHRRIVQANGSCLRLKWIGSWRNTKDTWGRLLYPPLLGSAILMDPLALGPAQTQERWVRTDDPLHLGPEDEPITLGLDDGPITCGSGWWHMNLAGDQIQGNMDLAIAKSRVHGTWQEAKSSVPGLRPSPGNVAGLQTQACGFAARSRWYAPTTRVCSPYARACRITPLSLQPGARTTPIAKVPSARCLYPNSYIF